MSWNTRRLGGLAGLMVAVLALSCSSSADVPQAAPTDIGSMTTEEGRQLELAVNMTDLAVQVASIPSTVGVGERLTYSVLIGIRGPNPAEIVEVTVTLDPRVVFVSGDGCAQLTVRTLICERDGPGGVSIVVRVDVNAPADGVLRSDFEIRHFADLRRFGDENPVQAHDPDLGNNVTTSETRIGSVAESNAIPGARHGGPASPISR